MAKSEKFAKLLTEAIYRIRRCENNRPIGVIQDELGYALGKEGRGAIEYWRRGFVPKLSDLELLAQKIVQHSDLNRAWVEQFLLSANCPYPEQICQKLFPDQETDVEITASGMPPMSLLPHKSYQTLIGRLAYVQEISAILADRNGHWIVVVDGLGGIGKTAIAHAVAEQSLKQNSFKQVVWINHAPEQPNPFDSYLDLIGYQLDLPDITQLPQVEKERRIKAHLYRKRILIVLDDLQISSGNQHLFIERLRALLSPSKALITSRHRFTGDLSSIHITGLPQPDAHAFVEQIAQERGLTHLDARQQAELLQIVDCTGGSPLAMKLVVSQLEHLPVSVVLHHLQSVQPLDVQPEADDYLRLYRSIYIPSWALLSEEGKALLVTMALFVPTVGGTLEEIRRIGSYQDVHLVARYINALWRLSLVDVKQLDSIDLDKKSYTLHALTQHFILADVLGVDGQRVVAAPIDFKELFKRNLSCAIDYMIEQIQADPVTLLSEMEQQWALHLLALALQWKIEWIQTCSLFLALAPKMLYAIDQERWLQLVKDGIEQSDLYDDLATQAHLQFNLGILYQKQANYREAYARLRSSATLFEQLNNQTDFVKALSQLGYLARLQRQYDKATTAVEEILSLKDATEQTKAHGLFVKGAIAFDKRNWQEAIDSFHESLRYWESQGNRQMIAQLLTSLGPPLREQEQYDESISCYERAIDLFAEVQDIGQQAVAKMNLGNVYLSRGQPAKALTYYSQAEPVLRKARKERHLAMIYTNQGMAHGGLRHWGEAEQMFLQSTTCWEEIGNIKSLVKARHQLGQVYRKQGRIDAAIELFQRSLKELEQITEDPAYAGLYQRIQKDLNDLL